MHERIRELAVQCGAWNQVYNPKDFMIDRTFKVEKFAELIVRECSNIACDYDSPKMSGPGMIIAGRIETHFGIEE